MGHTSPPAKDLVVTESPNAPGILMASAFYTSPGVQTLHEAAYAALRHDMNREIQEAFSLTTRPKVFKEEVADRAFAYGVLISAIAHGGRKNKMSVAIAAAATLTQVLAIALAVDSALIILFGAVALCEAGLWYFGTMHVKELLALRDRYRTYLQDAVHPDMRE